jgi:hypothetical protein
MVKERELNDVLQGVLVTGCGSNFQMQKLMMPFVEKIENEFRASGFADALDNPRLPPGKVPHRKPITAEAVVTPIIIGLALFLGSSVGSWAVGRVCDELWDKKIVLGIRKLRERYKRNFERKKDAPLSFIFKFDV